MNVGAKWEHVQIVLCLRISRKEMLVEGDTICEDAEDGLCEHFHLLNTKKCCQR